MRLFRYILLLLFTFNSLNAQTVISDSTIVEIEDSTKLIQQKDFALKDIVDSRAEDSTVLSMDGNKTYLYNKAEVDYQDIGLQAGYIEIDWKLNTAFASGIIDTAGNIVQKPIFKEGEKEYYTDTIWYNFTSKKARIKKVITQEGDGFLHGDRVKKLENNTFFIKGGSYTTCNYEEPHFRIKTNKTKVISGDKIVTGPAYLEILDVPTPLVLPFGFFPTETRRRSGIIIPTWGNNFERGYFLKDGGYYWAASDFYDLTVKGEIYTMGGWGLTLGSNYNKRYAFNGNFLANYNKIKIGREGFTENGGTFRNSTDFRVAWTHNQDPKARPDLRFTASVNIATGTYFQNTQQQANQVLTSQLNSNIAIQKSWIGKPYSLSVNLGHSQNIQQNTISLTLPKLAFNVNRFTPFKKESRIGESKWYEDIGVNYSFQAENRINTNLDDDIFSEQNLARNARYGAQHISSIQTNMKLFKYWTFSPSINMNNRWYGSRLSYNYIDSTGILDIDTVAGFNNAFDFALRGNLATKVYGQFNYRGKVRAIRHVLTPSIGFNYSPDFSDPVWGYYQTYQADSLGTIRTQSVYNGYLYGTPSKGVNASVNFGIQNTLEMKVKTDRDSSGLKKIKILEGFSVNTSYNAAATEFQWSDISLNARTSALDGLFQFQFSTRLDLYGIDPEGKRVNQSAYQVNGVLFRRTQTTFTTGIQLTPDRLFGGDKKSANQNNNSGQELENKGINMGVGDIDYMRSTDFVDFNVPWNLGMNFNMTWQNQGLVQNKRQSVDINASIELTKSWRIGFRTGYDMVKKDITFTTIDFYRDLHCWQINVFWVPFGFQRSYTIGISAKSNILQDLKLERRRGIGDFE